MTFEQRLREYSAPTDWYHCTLEKALVDDVDAVVYAAWAEIRMQRIIRNDESVCRNCHMPWSDSGCNHSLYCKTSELERALDALEDR